MSDSASSFQSFQIAMIILPTIAVVLRFWSRSLQPARGLRPLGSAINRFWWDDWFALISLPLSIFGNALAIWIVPRTLNSNWSLPTPADQEQFMKANFAGLISWDLAVSLPKTSAIFFYSRVFGSTRPFRQALWVGHAVILAWLTVALFVTIFTCNPPARWWDRTLEGTCMDPKVSWLIAIVPQTIIDLYVLVLPMPMLWKLQLQPARKALVGGVFVCGYSIAIISFTRMVLAVANPGIIGQDANPISSQGITFLYLLFFQPPMSIISICSPSIFQLVRRGVNHGWRSLFMRNYPDQKLAAERQDTVASRRSTKEPLMTLNDRFTVVRLQWLEKAKGWNVRKTESTST